MFYESDIPPVFKTYVSEEYFQECINCGKDLLQEGVHYMIEKAFKDNVVEFEHAICVDCARDMQSTMSEESLKNITDFFNRNFDSDKRISELYSDGEPSLEKWTNKCVISNESVNEIDEYQLYAHCNGKKLIYSVTPFIISGKVIEQMSMLLSSKTKDELDDYMDKHFNIPPEWKEILKDKKILLI